MIDSELMTIFERKLKYNTMNKLITKSQIKGNIYYNHSWNQAILAA